MLDAPSTDETTGGEKVVVVTTELVVVGPVLPEPEPDDLPSLEDPPVRAAEP